MKKKNVIIITVALLLLIFVSSIIVSIVMIKKNNSLKDSKLDIVISQQDGDKIVEVYRERFTDELIYTYTYKSKINVGKENTVIIKNGECYIVDSTCPTHSCEEYRITNKKGIFNSSTTITCLPNGLYISIEKAEE